MFITTIKSKAQVDNVQLYTFAHSLIDHRPPLISTPSDETTILHWMYDISQNAGKTFASTGQFGQLNNHVDGLRPNSNLGYDIVPNSWDENNSNFAASNLNTILLTAANFIQYSPPSAPDPSAPSGRTVIGLTETIFDWTDTQKPNMRYYIYGNWPEMDLQNAYPPNLPAQSEVTDFHNQTIGITGPFASWWTDYQDLLLASRPQLNAKLIPASMVISKILKDHIPNQVPFNELYEDSAPHGRANIYFLAGMISYMALYEEKVPSSYMPSTIIHNAIRTNLTSIIDFAWNEINNFNFSNGTSRVFYEEPILSTSTNNYQQKINITPNPVNTVLNIELPKTDNYMLNVVGIDGRTYQTQKISDYTTRIHVADIADGIYFIILKNRNNEVIANKKMIKKSKL